jgi:NDP-sugar pyrophosphorylase family protein/aminoglycoside/choline kinase family phosphotransferase
MPKFPVNIFLPAAGFGERLRPITNHLPKPLLPILGKPLIEIILERITAVCGNRIGINLHWKSGLIRSWAAPSPWKERIAFFPEDPILGTGGALKNAEEFLSSSHFLVHNADILLDIDFARLIETHLTSGNLATLATHNYPKYGNVVIDENNLLVTVENPGDSRPDPNTIAKKVAYTGIALYSPDILKFLPTGVSHMTVAWVAAAKAGHRVQAFDVTGAYWNDIGTPASYVASVLDALRENGETVYLSPAAKCGKISIDGYIVMESGSEVRAGAALRNCVVMPGARVSGRHENRIIGPDYTVDLTETEVQPSIHAREQKKIALNDPLFARYFGVGNIDEHGLKTVDSRLSGNHGLNSAIRNPQSVMWSDAILIGLGGSDRRYFRLRNNGKTAVLMECRPDDPDYERHLVYTRFFEAHSVPVPGLLAFDDENKHALFEDLGDTSLYSYLKLPNDNAHVEDLYRSVLDILVALHGLTTAHIRECPQLRDRIFDYDYLRWETNYFLDQFVAGFRKTAPRNKTALQDELNRLARIVDACPKGVIHRDFQCQNIMITPNDIPRVIDFQGARMAPPAYDVASILWDPYYRLDEGIRERLIDYYVDEMNHGSEAFNEELFRKSLIPCRLQRHMQALGAYGFLSVVKGKKYFLKHVPEALRLLREETTEAIRDYPELHELVHSLL